MGFFNRKKKQKEQASPSSTGKQQSPSSGVRRQEQSRKVQGSGVRESARPPSQQQRPRPQQSQSLPPKPSQPVSNMAAVATAIANSAPPPPPPEPVVPSPPAVVAPENDAQQMQESAQAGIDLTRNLVKKFIADIWNRGEIDLIPEVCSPSLRFNGNTGFDRVGHDGLVRMVATIREALDDYHCEIHSMVVEHNKAFCRLRFTGKHTGNLLGYPPTGRVVGWMGATEFTCQNGKILKVWELGDIKTLEEQLIAIDDQPLDGGHDE
mmetsp:Transcript_8245/g.17189  ORF Transcript_8245/g.17189 Transcript_8245/m.17189 type:complete len:265 (-) Transcript_8245:217-1011(-)|eukprot:CAMPEP_0172457088 /NCGR_PEP_ID=MMETSP1065-20121228/19780_1 /TAXON_ID=265537 /ORGANISM="Amphiprora paludosa, Strain CCMP125" /LENGTH=264 /DNA_ID=CAMNT_0013210573 /DNA_START=69 /DNA_END=863 /DNA_ORIENTATION=-